MTHELKILPKYFDAVNCGLKNFEIRINDRNYQEYDELILKEWERGKYTGRECRRWVGYIYHGDGTYGIAENTVVMALKRSAPMKSIDGADLTERMNVLAENVGHALGIMSKQVDDLTQKVELLSDLASAEPEIVLCKDCKNSLHWYRDRRRCFLWSEDGVSVFDDGFCSYAERRTDG